MKQRMASYRTIIAEKPDTFCCLPKSVVPLEEIEKLKKIPRLALGEICGIESISAMCSALDRTSIDALLPTIVYTGAEFGHWQTLISNLKKIKKLVEKYFGIYCLDPVILGSPAFWWALNGRFIYELTKRFNFYSPCLGCRLYSLAVLVPLCKQIGCMIILSGVTQQKNEAYTINTSEEVMYYSKTMLSNFGINLIKGDENRMCAWHDLVDLSSDNGNRCSNCLLKDNYRLLNDCLPEIPENKKYFEQFAIPAAAKIISRTLAGKETNYLQEVADTLLPGKKTKR
jgi:hypothetical protein